MVLGMFFVLLKSEYLKCVAVIQLSFSGRWVSFIVLGMFCTLNFLYYIEYAILYMYNYVDCCSGSSALKVKETCFWSDRGSHQCWTKELWKLFYAL